jgi:hypothetical protein
MSSFADTYRSKLHEEVRKVHQGHCPRCQGPGPVDVHVSHRVWSALVVTRYSTRSIVSCKSCGTKARLLDSALALVLGWWGLPWGLIMTPVQIGRNVVGFFSAPDPRLPSTALEAAVRSQLAPVLESDAGQSG